MDASNRDFKKFTFSIFVRQQFEVVDLISLRDLQTGRWPSSVRAETFGCHRGMGIRYVDRS